jgi:gamma-glutamyl-gamma-aminobutyrate hydrolase PuuD
MSIQTNLEKKESGHKFYASACSEHDGNWLKTLDFNETDNIEDADVIIFGGGADIEPSTYGEEKGSNTHTSPQREAQERADFKKGTELGKKFFGICRG